MTQLSRNSDRQQESIQLPLIDGHVSEPGGAVVSEGLVLAQPDLLSAVKLAMVVSGLQDKQIAGTLGIDVSQWSRIKSGDARLPLNRFTALMKRLGNDIPLRWLAHQLGYELRPLRTTVEAERDRAISERDDALRQLATIKAFVKDTRT